MVPVLDKQNKPLMPCTPKRARLLMERKQGIAFFQKGIFCIKLSKEPSARNYQLIALGIDPGSKREGYTAVTKNSVVINITTDTPDWVKEKIENRRNLRRSRRFRKTPYRKCRENRRNLMKQGKLAPSTKARWGAKLRIIKNLLKILPITIVNCEDIKAVTKAGKKKWNISFSPLETGKNWFYSEVENLGLQLIKTSGKETSEYRKFRGFQKSKNKLDFKWETHNVDSHCLAEMAIGKPIAPYFGLWQINFMNFHRRRLHVENPSNGGIRKNYGGTRSLGFSRGSIIRYKKDNLLYYLGGTSNNCVAIHSIVTGKRINQFVKVAQVEILYNNKLRTQFLPRLKPWVSLLRRL